MRGFDCAVLAVAAVIASLRSFGRRYACKVTGIKGADGGSHTIGPASTSVRTSAARGRAGENYTFSDLGGAAWNSCGPCGDYYDPTALSGGRKSGLLGAIHAGYNWQFAPAWLIGVEGDFTWTHLNQSVTGTLSSPGYPVVNSAGLNFQTDANGWLRYGGVSVG